jgi:hypothetical protein
MYCCSRFDPHPETTKQYFRIAGVTVSDIGHTGNTQYTPKYLSNVFQSARGRKLETDEYRDGIHKYEGVSK